MLPIGLGIFAGISVIALIVVGLVTYERTKYRKVRYTRISLVYIAYMNIVTDLQAAQIGRAGCRDGLFLNGFRNLLGQICIVHTLSTVLNSCSLL